MNDLLLLMHDTAHDLSRISAQEALIKKKMQFVLYKNPELKDYIESAIFSKVDEITQSRKDLADKLDKYYLKQKEMN